MENKRKRLKKKVCLAVIGSPYGLKGNVWIKIFNPDPRSLKVYKVLYDEAGRAYEIMTLRMKKNGVIVHFKGVEGRSAAEALKGINLYARREHFPSDLDDDEFYQVDLIGLCVYNGANKILGYVSGVFNFGAGDLLEICLETRKTVLIPFRKASVPKVCIPRGFLIIDPVKSGLLEYEDKDTQTE